MIALLNRAALLLSTIFRARRRAVGAWRERRRPRILVRIVDEEPARPVPRTLHVSMRVGRPAVGWLACPCGCGDTISLRLAGNRSPRWELRRPSGPATLVPSVWRKAACRSHFILRDGRVHWC